jgi:hypothetical protein
MFGIYILKNNFVIISANPNPSSLEFNLLLDKSLTQLNAQAKKSPKEISLLMGNKLEPFIKEIIEENAIGTIFENSIELISGQKFPDIIANKFYGIEVKSTTQNHWKTTGNSVLESTRVEGVERIHMLFGKLGTPIEFRCRPYEECLSEVVVTHSPRYLIDMNLEKGATIFDKMDTQYDVLRNQTNPIKNIIEYYKSKLKPGEDVWWMGDDNSKSSSFIIRIWKNLNPEEKHKLKIKALAFFPELLSNNSDKFGRLAIWLVTNEGVVCPNIRDVFTAGGKTDLILRRETYKNVPRIFSTLIENIPDIFNIILNTSTLELSEHWNAKINEKNKMSCWIDLVSKEANKISDAKHLNLQKMIKKALT